MGWGFREWRPYVSVGQKLARGRKKAAALAKKQKRQPQPVELPGRAIATTFWGKAWCDNLESYQDYANRLPRGVTYVRNGSVADLVIGKGQIDAIVAGSEAYSVRITIRPLGDSRWKSIKSDCSRSIDSLLDLLAGKLSAGVMKRMTDRTKGLFPAPSEMKMSCSCPDYSTCCKHIAAVMYGVGSRLDRLPDLLFTLRGVDHRELASQAIAAVNLDRELGGQDRQLDGQDLGEVFGIELAPAKVPEPLKASRRARPRRGGPLPSVLTEPPVSPPSTLRRKPGSRRRKLTALGPSGKPKRKVRPTSAAGSATRQPSIARAAVKPATVSKPLSKGTAKTRTGTRSREPAIGSKADQKLIRRLIEKARRSPG